MTRYFLASVLLLSVAVGLVAVSSARRTRQELVHQLEERGLALAEAVEVASRSAIRGNALLEELVARRLLDNARLLDRLLEARPLDAATLAAIRDANGLRRVDLLDRDGRPWTPPAPPSRPMMGMGPMRRADPAAAERHRAMMTFMWGRRWGRPPAPEAEAGPEPPALRDRRFWEGSVFGVAIGARSFPGVIAVHADAAYVLNFRKEIGVEQQMAELARQAGVESVALLAPDRTVLARSHPTPAAEADDDGLAAEALGARRAVSRLLTRPDGREVLVVVRPFALEGAQLGVLRIDLATRPIREAWARDLRFAVGLGLAVLLVGGLGLAAIFSVHGRHAARVRALEAEMARGERLAALGNLAAVVAHEVRNPLNAISVGLQRLRAELPPADGAAEHARMVELMQGEARRLNGIVDEFLSLARPLPLAPAAFAPGALVAEVAALVEPEARARGVDVAWTAAPDLPAVRLDPDRMKQVLLNLVRNALDAMPDGGRLALAASRQPGALALTVDDTGAGIPADLLPRVFEPYVTTKSRGVGLGLAIARRIVEAHGGRLEASSGIGRGSRFTVTLPLPGAPARG
jgi:signal transduction histidine kinase